MAQHGAGYHWIADAPRIAEARGPGYSLFGLDGAARIGGRPVRLERDEDPLLDGLRLNAAAQAYFRGAAIKSTRVNPTSTDDNATDFPNLYARIAPAATASDLPSEGQLIELARLMKWSNLQSGDSTISAAYTYFGQLIAHDLTRSQFTDTPTKVINEASPALDFDTLFGPVGTDCKPAGKTICEGGLSLGYTQNEKRPLDLPRAANSHACIADDRNDQNMMLAQMVVAITQFHHCVKTLCHPKDDTEHRRITVQHLQSIVLDDFARHLVPCPVIQDVRTNGRASVRPDIATEDFQIPIEFALAGFRFGHAMVRESYDLSIYLLGRRLEQVLTHTGRGGALQIGSEWRLPDDWSVNWQQVMATGFLYRHTALEIDAGLNFEMRELPGRLLDETQPPANFNLAERTLVRGHKALLPTGQAMVEQVNEDLKARNIALGTSAPTLLSVLDATKIGATKDHDISDYLVSDCSARKLSTHTPLWLYILREAAIEREQPYARAIRYQGLGNLGGRIVYETLHAAVQASMCSILDKKGKLDFVASEQLKPNGDRTRFELKDLFWIIDQAKP